MGGVAGRGSMGLAKLGGVFAWAVAAWSAQQPREVWEIFGFRPFCKLLCLGYYQVKFDVWDIIWCSQAYFVICGNLICHSFIGGQNHRCFCRNLMEDTLSIISYFCVHAL